MNLYIGNIDKQVTEKQLADFFCDFDSLGLVKIIKNKLVNATSDFGFVQVIDPIQALNAIKKLNGTLLNNKTVQVSEL